MTTGRKELGYGTFKLLKGIEGKRVKITYASKIYASQGMYNKLSTVVELEGCD